jgi:putative ABC transport system permease protein
LLFPLLAIFALIAVGVGVILIAQITRLSVEERRHEIAIAAALGASPLSAVTGFLAEAALLGIAGSVTGVLLGIVLARPVVASASELTQLFAGVNVPVVVEPGVVAVGLATGVFLAVLAAIIPSVSASNTAIATQLSGRAAHKYTESRRHRSCGSCRREVGYNFRRPRALAGRGRQCRGHYRDNWTAFGRSISERSGHQRDPAPA